MPQDGNRYELIDGELFVTASPRTKHQMLSMRLSGELWSVILPSAARTSLHGAL